jgi:TorA maturation chaperone TorD
VERLTGAGDGQLPEAVRRLVACLDRITISDWTREHERMFGHAVQGSSPPYELEYGEEHSHRQPQELGDIAAFYHAFGVRAHPAAHERVDSVVAECDFMQWLLYKQACALDEDQPEAAGVCEAAARRFLAEHLGQWAPAFALRLLRASGGVLAEVAEALLAWIVSECARAQVPAGSRDLPLRASSERDIVTCTALCGGPPTESSHGSCGPSR